MYMPPNKSGPFKAAEIERQSFAIVDDADRDVGLRFASSPDD
jgi:hypothetical protein